MPFKPGESGNPNGINAGRKKMSPEMRKALEDYGIEGINNLIDLARNAKEERDRIKATTELLDRGYGKAVQAIEAEITDLRPIVFDAALGGIVKPDATNR